MRIKRGGLYATFIILLVLLVACLRTYPNGDTEEVGVFDATIDFIAGTPERKELDEVDKLKLTGNVTQDKVIIEENEKIAEQNEIIRKHNKGAKHDRKNPQSGLLAALGALATAFGVGYVKTVLNKKTIEAGRDIAHEENIILKGRIQAVKEVHRDDASALDKIKRYGAIGADIARDNMAMLKDHKDDIEMFKDKYKTLHEAKNG